MAQQEAVSRSGQRLIDSVGIGRVALSRGALPIVVVVRCETDGDRVVLRGDDPNLLGSALAGDVVALQVDDIRTDGRGSSMVITGVLATDDRHVIHLTPSIVSHTELHLGPSRLVR